ncbi:hypothetical protein QQF64_029255 [Cirrhinus molitorella]|uniref:Uncharacterized protein n=1 Tax=Cirrhinus molitorella TaxID=172907 RepID=A0ABR3N8W4_9TELE
MFQCCEIDFHTIHVISIMFVGFPEDDGTNAALSGGGPSPQHTWIWNSRCFSEELSFATQGFVFCASLFMLLGY